MTDTTTSPATTVAPAELGSYERHCKARICNKTDTYFHLRVLYQYTGSTNLNSGWFILRPGAELVVFPDITYWTGAFTSGHNQWKVQGIKLKEVINANDLAIHYDGKQLTTDVVHMMNEGYWVTHELEYGDEGDQVTINVSLPNVEIISYNGTTSKKFDKYN